MKKTILAAALLSLGTIACAQTAISVNGQTISSKAQREVMAQIAKQGVTDKAQQENMARAYLIEQAIINQEAKKQKIDQQQSVKDELNFMRHRLYINELVKKHMTGKEPTAAQLTEIYNKEKDAYSPNEVKISQILVKDEATARDLIRQINAGVDFAGLARTHSLDKATADNGGALPMVNIRMLRLPGLAEAAVALNKGQVLSVPFKSDAGYLVIKLDDKREVPFPAEAQIKDKLVELWKKQQAEAYLQNLMKSAKITAVQARAK